eukprot:gene28799-38076_t
MASLAALLRAYDLDAGDVIYVDSGNYKLVTNIPLAAQDSGVEIRGAVQPGHATVLDRGNTNTGAYVIELQGATDVKLSNLNITGGQYGIFAGTTANSDRLTVSNSFVYGNAARGISIDSGNEFFTLSNTQSYLNGGSGVAINAADANVTGGSFWRNTGWGLEIGGSAARAHISGADVYGNSSGGITASVSGGAASQVVGELIRRVDLGGQGRDAGRGEAGRRFADGVGGLAETEFEVGSV